MSDSIANPLWRLRGWLTLNEAAISLSASTGVKLRVADILHLALDGHLKLSVHLPGTDAVCFQDDGADRPSERLRIDGLWDLPLNDAARRQVEHELHHELGLPFVSMEGTRGATVTRDHTRCQLKS